jgi:PAS domain S-box-containing protein
MSEPGKLQLISAITQEINAGKTLEEILDIVYERLRDFVPYNRIGVCLISTSEDRVKLVALKSDGPASLPVGYVGKLGGSSLAEIIATGRTRILNDLVDYLRRKPESAGTKLMIEEGMRSSLTLPLIVRAKPVGLIFFSSRAPNTYRSEHEEFLRLISGHLAIALEKSLLLKELREKSDYLENILRNSADAIIVVDRGHIIRSWNHGAEKIFGFRESEMIGQHFSKFVPAELSQAGELDEIQRRVEIEGYIAGYETVRLTKDGRRLSVNLTTTAIRDEQGRIIGRSAILRDLTPLKRLQEEVVRTQSLAAVGELAASVAHEIKNPLAGISGAVQVLSRSFATEDSRRPIVHELLQQVKRLDDTVRDLLIFARPWKPQPRSFDLSHLLNGILDRSRAPGTNVRMNRDMPPSCMIQADPQLLEHVFVNVVQNAIEAMPSGGQLTVRVTDDPSSAQVRIADTGIGIAPHNREKLFRPFFSTKSKGTGLGLAITKKLVEAHHGSIDVESQPGRGTVVQITLPKDLEET